MTSIQIDGATSRRATARATSAVHFMCRAVAVAVASSFSKQESTTNGTDVIKKREREKFDSLVR